jgi:bifunctional DNA-binding transcriptional regulator/antitoxin component of YhaV-PrlF toxin-antitoxin module
MSKGCQVTIPAEWRNELGLKPEKNFHMEKNGKQIIISSMDDNVNSLKDIFAKADSFPKHNLTPKQIKDMDVILYG